MADRRLEDQKAKTRARKLLAIWRSRGGQHDESKRAVGRLTSQLEKNFFQGFELLDDEIKSTPLTKEQIFLLDEYLEKIETQISNYKNTENENSIDEIKADTSTIRRELGKQTKGWIAEKLSIVLAKITKEGPLILKGIFESLTKEIVSQGVKFFIEQNNKLL